MEIVNRLRREGPSLTSFRTVLAEGKGATREWPDDKDFEKNFCSKAIYNKSLNSSQIKLILQLINDQLVTPQTEQITVSNLEIEHIMPQAWYDNYELEGEIMSKEIIDGWDIFENDDEMAKSDKVEERNNLIHSIGNLTIVTKSLNAAMRNGPFKGKKKDLRNSILFLNRYFDKIETWDEKEIDRRARWLFAGARKIWAGPSKE